MAFSETDKKILQIGIFIAVFAGVGLIWYMLTIQRPELERQAKEIKKMDEELKVLRNKYAEMKQMVDNQDKVKRDLEILKEAARRLPTSRDRFNFFVELSDILQLTGVRYSKIVPMKESVKAVYTEIPYTIVSLARYHEYGQFLNMIEQNPRRFMRVKEFTISNDEKRPSLHPVNLCLATFMFNKTLKSSL